MQINAPSPYARTRADVFNRAKNFWLNEADVVTAKVPPLIGPGPSTFIGPPVKNPFVARSDKGHMGPGPSIYRSTSAFKPVSNNRRAVPMAATMWKSSEQAPIDDVIQNRLKFLDWMRLRFPAVYEQLPIPSDTGLGLTPLQSAPVSAAEPSKFNKILSSISSIFTGYTQYRTQKKILDTQLKRASMGLPPLSTGQYAPTMRIAVQPSEAITRSLKSGMNVILIGGALLGAFILLPRLLKR